MVGSNTPIKSSLMYLVFGAISWGFNKASSQLGNLRLHSSSSSYRDKYPKEKAVSGLGCGPASSMTAGLPKVKVSSHWTSTDSRVSTHMSKSECGVNNTVKVSLENILCPTDEQ